MDFNVTIRIGDHTRSIRFEHQLNKEDLDGFANSEGWNSFTDMILEYCIDTEEKKVIIDKFIAGNIDCEVEDYIEYDLCLKGALKHYLMHIYRDKAYDAFNDWVDDQISDFGEEYFMLEV